MIDFEGQSELEKRGSETARNGFKNEDAVVEQFNQWKTVPTAQEWLVCMGYVISEIEWVKAEKISGHYKADIQVQITIKQKNLIDAQNIQVKLVSNPQGFNQIDKRRVDKYVELWNMPEDVAMLFKYFTGEVLPYISNPRDERRMFVDEFNEDEQRKLINFLKSKQTLIVGDVLKGRGKLAAEWFLVIVKLSGSIRWTLQPINHVLNFYGNGEVVITNRGSLKIGRIGIQRKGGDGGREGAKMLQFKINPVSIFED